MTNDHTSRLRFWDCNGVPVSTFESGEPEGFIETFAWDGPEPRPFGLTTVMDDGFEIDEERFRAMANHVAVLQLPRGRLFKLEQAKPDDPIFKEGPTTFVPMPRPKPKG